MRKLIAFFTTLTVVVWVVGPVVVLGDYHPDTPIQTHLTVDTSGDSDDPIKIKGKWEMKGPCFRWDDQNQKWVYNYCKDGNGIPHEGEDDDPTAGAQFDAPGVWGEKMDYTVCAIVHGPDMNIERIRDVYAEIFYPQIPMHKYSYPPYQQLENPDNPTGGCGAMIEQNKLIKLSQADAYHLVCDVIRTQNPDLIEWNDCYEKDQNNQCVAYTPGTDWDELCGDMGELTKGWAAVYCADKYLIWEDPAGDYRVVVTAYDTDNNPSEPMENYFTYKEFLGFEVDFEKVNYGDVRISEHKRIYGDEEFCGEYTTESECNNTEGRCYWNSGKCYSNYPTIRNTGNVRLNIRVAQDDMNLGKRDSNPSQWNVEYDARVGDLEDDWTNYKPFGVVGTTPKWRSDYKKLKGEILDLSEVEEMDFSIHVIEKWPGNQPSYTGYMWLGATKADFDSCRH